MMIQNFLNFSSRSRRLALKDASPDAYILYVTLDNVKEQKVISCMYFVFLLLSLT